jgi:hypothetical protein
MPGQPPIPQGYAPYQEASGKATAALVLGICGLVVCPLVCSIIGLVLGYQAKSEIDASGGRIGGRGSATAGIVLGWIGVGFSVLFIILIVVIAITDPSAFDEAMISTQTLFS